MSTLNRDYERRSLWSATMPALSDRTGRDLPDAADVVVIGGGYTGVNAARELAARGVAVTLLEAETLGWGASTRNGGIVHAGYKWGPRQLIRRYGEATGAALYRDTLAGYETVKRLIAEGSIDCDFREVGHLELAYARSHVRLLEEEHESLTGVGVASQLIPRERVREEIGSEVYHGALIVPSSGLLHPGRYFAGLAAAADRAGADLHEGVRARTIRRQADGRYVVETARGAILARDVLVATNGYTDGVAPSLRRRIIPIGSYIIASEPLPEDLVRELSPRVGRSSTRRTSCTTGTSRPTAGWSSVAGPGSGRRRSIGWPGSCIGPARGPSADGRPADRLRLGRQRRLHVRPDAACRSDVGWGGLRDGLLRHRHRHDDPPRDARSGSGWPAVRRRSLTKLRSRWSRAV